MQKQYDPHSIEEHWYRLWEQRSYFRADPDAASTAFFCIMIPPPNVTGTLHMGHAFQDTLMDILVRMHRMQGDSTLWQPGTDHAGIATQMVVERQLAAQGLSRHDIGRDAFIERVWQWRQESGDQISRQLRRLGASCDWSRERFTMDEGLSKAVIEVFVRLYDEGLIYRGKRLVNWDPVLHTAISDLEVVSEEEQGKLWHLRYPLADTSGQPTHQHLIVATTRPETLLGDSAVAVNPGDARYRHLIGRQVWLPLAQRLIPVIGDDYVDPDFGSGCVKITPAHDFNDYVVGQRHDLPVINIFTPDAAINDQAPAPFRGLDRFVAREKVIEALEAGGLLEKIEPHRLTVPRGDRSGAVLEPYLTDQWFVDLTRETQADGRPGGRRAIVQPAVEAVRDGRIQFVPENWSKVYFQWLDNIQDWCISRQLWWGHRIPAWYDEENSIYVGRDEDEVRRRHRLGPEIQLRQDEDVLDTWFSSALWPFSTLGWPQQTPELKHFYPTSTLVTGFDIIFFWVARMIMMGVKFAGNVPFREIYIHGLVRDSEGQKMSKSKGNVLDPIDLIDGIDVESLVTKRTQGLMQPQMAESIAAQTRRHYPEGIPSYGTDALRFTFAALATRGRDINFDLGRVEGYRNFCNKLWNAARYVLLATEGADAALGEGEVELSAADRWIVSRLQRTEKAVLEAVASYRFDLAAQAIYEFTWDEYCDWYLELSKPLLQSAVVDPPAKRGTRRTLVGVLEALLRLAHPFMPFITEEIWQRVSPLAGHRGETIMLRPYPKPDADRIDQGAETEIEWLRGMILAVRRIRGEMNLPPSQALPVVLQDASDDDRERLDRHRLLIDRVARIESIELLAPGQPAPESATALLGGMKILVPLAGLIDVKTELARLDKELARLDKEHQRIAAKLANQKFLENAPATVVEKERRRDQELRRAIEELGSQRQRIAKL